jgi:hypothetical protein
MMPLLMATTLDLQTWILEALRAKGGRAHLLDVCKHIWSKHEQDLRNSGDLFFKWQYDVRWAAQRLRHQRELKAVGGGKSGFWELADSQLSR